MRIAMSQVLPEALGEITAYFFAPSLAKSLHGKDILIYAMMRQQPIPLAFMAAEHLLFGVNDSADVYIHAWIDGIAEFVIAFKGIHVVKIGNWFRRLRSHCLDIRHSAGEAGSLDKQTGHFMVDHVVIGAWGKDNCGLHLAYSPDRF